MIGIAFESNLNTVGGSASSGKPAADAIEPRAHFVGRFAQVGAPREVQPQVGVAFRRGRIDALEAGRRR
jgi:hypothetical protein